MLYCIFDFILFDFIYQYTYAINMYTIALKRNDA